MRKINSIHYGGKVLTIGVIVGVVIPCICWLFAVIFGLKILLVIRNVFFVLGMVIMILFFLHLAIEFYQDKKIDQYYTSHNQVKQDMGAGVYECASCGNRQVTQSDHYCRLCGVEFIEYKDKTPQEILDSLRKR